MNRNQSNLEDFCQLVAMIRSLDFPVSLVKIMAKNGFPIPVKGAINPEKDFSPSKSPCYQKFNSDHLNCR